MNKNDFFFRIITGAMILFATACSVASPTIPGVSETDCLSRRGQCFDATVNGAIVSPLNQKLHSFLQSIKGKYDMAVQVEINDVGWAIMLPSKTRPPLEVTGKQNSLGIDWFGSDPEVSIDLKRPLLTYEKVSPSQKLKWLPDGLYLASINASGKSNWDRKMLLIVIGEIQTAPTETTGGVKQVSALNYSDFVGVWVESSQNSIIKSEVTNTFTLSADGSCSFRSVAIENGSGSKLLDTNVKAACEFKDGYLIYRGKDEKGNSEINRFRIVTKTKENFEAKGADNGTYKFKAKIR